MIKRINHVGVVVRNIEEALDLYTNTLGFKSAKILVEKEAGFKTVMVSLGEVTLELTEPTDPQGGIQKFLDSRGEGIHHISLEVDDLKKEINSLESKGIRFINREPVTVEGDCVSFVHPKSMRGVLIELIERAS
jgi:lactoylglutathione lyase/methylmalonyl-CoA/ethylmalonyl-CoA epimerase